MIDERKIAEDVAAGLITNQNDLLLDELRARMLLPLTTDLSLRGRAELTPVISLNGYTAPPYGITEGEADYAVPAGGVGTRSEFCVTADNLLGQSFMVEVFLRFIAEAGVNYRIVRTTAGITGYTAQAYILRDFRRSIPAAGTPIFMGTKNTAAATAGSNVTGISVGPTSGWERRIYGPFYLNPSVQPGQAAIIVRPDTDNTALNAGASFRVLRR